VSESVDLVLHGPDADKAESLTPLVRPRSSTQHAANVVRLHQVDNGPTEREAVMKACEKLRLDFAFVPSDARLSDYKLIAMDMDSTLITIECIDELADMAGIKPQVAAITEAAMRGEFEFAESLRLRVALLKDLPASTLEKVYAERVRLSPGADALLARARELGIKTLLVSGGFTFFVERLKDRLGLDFAYSNVLEIVDGRLTGRVQGEVFDAGGKRRALLDTCATLGISPGQAIAMGDGANDLPMMGAAGVSIAYRAKPLVRSKARYALNHVGLDGLLQLFL